MQFLTNKIRLAAAALAMSSAMALSSCAPKAGCDTLVCQNGGSCAADFCDCPPGYDGPECQNVISDRYLGVYAGFTRPRNGDITRPDTADVYRTGADLLTLSVVLRSDPTTIYTGQLDYKNEQILVSDIVSDNKRTVVSVTLDAPTTAQSTRTLKLFVSYYENNKQTSTMEFNGPFLKR